MVHVPSIPLQQGLKAENSAALAIDLEISELLKAKLLVFFRVEFDSARVEGLLVVNNDLGFAFDPHGVEEGCQLLVGNVLVLGKVIAKCY